MSTTRWRSGLLLVAAALAACAGPSGPVRTETRTLTGFHAVELRGAAEAQITVGGSPSLTITADDASMKELQAEVKDGVLIVQTRRQGGGWFQRRSTVKLQIETASVDSLVFNGAGDFKLREVIGPALHLVMAGAGSLSATGRVDKLDARIDGAGSVELDKLAAVDAEVSVNGAGSLSVCASGNLNATVNGVGSITYSCNPQKTVTSLHGVGSIEPAGGKNP
jgi:hypothetical protein